MEETGDTFLNGATDVFRQNEIGDCFGLKVPDKLVPVMEIRHFGGDGLNLVWVRLILDDQTFLMCADCTNDGWVDSNNDIQCTCR